jgi:hypothetical protein
MMSTRYKEEKRREERNEFSVYTQLGSEDDAGLDPLGMNSVS